MLVIVVPVVAVTAGAVLLLLRVLDTGSSTGRLELIRTALAVGAGTGAIMTLVLAWRRQQATEHDAAERRLTELYLKAVEQLGSDQAAVRHGALYALERVAQDNPDHRQVVVDVLCAYLRAPFTPPQDRPGARRLGGVGGSLRRNPARRITSTTALRRTILTPPVTLPGDELRRQEREVRLTAQRILTRHLRPGDNFRTSVPMFWPGLDLDLTDAVLIDLDFSGCHLRVALFDKATFTGETWFEQATFTGAATFGGATFTDYAWFEQATFAAHAWFVGTTFTDDANFEKATFAAHASFGRTRFTGDTRFDRATFIRDANFEKATFTGDASFDGATFTRSARFRWMPRSRDTDHGARFDGATFTSYARFDRTTFIGTASFGKATFTRGADFSAARFYARATWEGGWFERVAVMTGATARTNPGEMTDQDASEWPIGWTTANNVSTRWIGDWGAMVPQPVVLPAARPHQATPVP
ncbi:pentapeptide repeat-containing protein [Saccharothrix syringae]|uniref:pentapeptide repeat-containing protein n=1 Tax=Saccharothrix syringae TaxID=103733 RepID=UPI000689A688|nr:pentapeptide repeat-containing protein [Saccharothrix syringae]